MDKPPSTAEVQANLENLQTASFRVIAIFAGVIGYTWLIANIWTQGAQEGIYDTAQLIAWLGNGLLLASTVAGLLLWKRRLHMAMHVLVWGILGAVLCAALSIPSPGAIFLFVLPVVFASVLLNRRGFFTIALLAGSLTLVINLARLPLPVRPREVLLPALIMVLVILGAWLSTHNLYTTLAWIWGGYERARRNEQLARERQAELSRALKSLGEAHYRLERANYMLTVAYDRAEEARRLKQQFAQTISHELRTPLNLIVGFTEVMTRSPEYYGGQLTPAYMRDLRIVYRNARHLQDLVNDVLDLARIESAQMGIMPEKVQPGELVREVLTTARSLVESRGLALHTEIAPDLPRLWLDPTRIRQVLFNLLNNAARFTEQGSITVRVWQEGEEVCFSVTDTGVGIAPEDVDRVFEEFQQVDGSIRRHHGGTGLGLAISKRFVTLHKGRMGVESRLGAGSTFYFSLPLSRANLDEGTAVGQPLHIAVPEPSAQREDLVLLIVTPHLPMAALLTRYLPAYRTLVASDLEQARAMARRLLPQAVVVDQVYGLTELDELTAFARTCELPQAMFVTCPLSQGETPQQRLDVAGYLTKPISHHSLRDLLGQVSEDVSHMDKLLIIDDDNDFVQLLNRMLETSDQGYQIINAYSGQEGLTLMRHHQPDVVLLDLGLPDMDGSEVVTQIRAMPAYCELPIIVVTGQDVAAEQGVLHGGLMMTRGDGLTFSQIVRWLQLEVEPGGAPDVTSTAPPSAVPAGSPTTPAP